MTKSTKRAKQQSFASISDLLKNYKAGDEVKYISREFQQYGYDLAEELDDLKNKSLYIKLAKETPRGLLESARSFVKDAQDVKSKGKLFMWKLKQLKDERTKKQKNLKDQRTEKPKNKRM